VKPAPILALLAVTVAAVAALLPTPAAAAGGPILVTAVPDGEGIDSPDGSARYATVSAGDTTVVKVMKGSGEIASMTYAGRTEKGRFGIPQVAADGSTSGLSADGKTLVLIKSSLPYGNPDRSKFVVLGTNRLHVEKRIGLEGQYSFDAISPDGHTAYVVEYPRPFRYDRYRVLKLDLKTGRLAKDPVADEDVGLDEESEEEDGKGAVESEMRGLALSRVDSDDGRWAYTLYDGGGDVPFIHALDTVGDRAVCIFMPQLEDLGRREIGGATISDGPEAGTLSVVGRDDQELARVDTATFAVTTPANEVSESGSAVALAIAIALVTVAIGSVAVIRRRRSTPG
jgi:hypothetical protein